MSAPAIDMARPWAIPSTPGGDQPRAIAGRRPALGAPSMRTGPDRRAEVAAAGAPRSALGARPQRIAPSVRLTRRGRTVLVAAFLVVGLLGSWPTLLRQGFPAGSTVAAAPVPPAQAPGAVLHRAGLARPYTVSPGDSLWSIAITEQLAADPRRAVEQIAELSALADADLVPGEQLWLPVPAARLTAQGSGG